MNEDYRLSVVFCAVNESYSLMQAFQKIDSYAAAFEYLFVLSKKSAEKCTETVKEICKKENCSYIIQSGKGLGNAIRDGIKSVTGTHIIFWPADDGMDTASFPEMVGLSMNNPEAIVTVSRWLKKDGFNGYGKIRKIINGVSQRLFAFLYRSDLTDFTNPTQIAPVALYRKINWQGTGFDFIPEMTFKPLRLGCRFIEVPCKNNKREDGSSNSRFFQLIKYYFVILKIMIMKKKDITVSVDDR